MFHRLCLLVCLASTTVSARAGIIINEVFINPPGSADDIREFIELLGTPNMKLDGYAIAFANGTQQKLYPAGSIPPRPAVWPEIDEFFSLDGLTLGPNGILVLGNGASTAFYPTMLPDSNFKNWLDIWNGGLDTPGNLQNDGCNTILLIRQRPGRTQADPGNPLGLRWGKDIDCDDNLIIIDDPNFVQGGNGDLDRGGGTNPDGLPTLDLVGALTPEDLSDDLEIVDEVSYEHDQGWEYDVDSRLVDLGSPVPGLPQRKVHALDDPQGFNPDALTRVDYRTKGPGWTPAPGATGALPNGNNWQDTATEQWIRGDSVQGTGGQGGNPQWFYSNAANSNPDAIQPYLTNVPLWLNDGIAPDFNFAAPNTCQIMAGRLNPFATPYIPGDTDRDGDCDLDDIAKVRAVFGDDDWVFSNGWPGAPAGNAADPATQTRPWDVDGTGDNGIEASDLQWTLNFQGSTTGRIVGRTYDSTTPETTGVHLNNPADMFVTLFAATHVPSGNPLNALVVGDTVEITLRGQVTGNPILLAGQENGVMQFVHDVTMATGGVAKVTNIAPLGPYAITRSSLIALQGNDGDLGAKTINGYTTSFTLGLTAPADLTA